MTPEAADQARADIVLGDAEILEAVAAGGAFGGVYSIEAATHMFGRNHQPAIDDVAAKAEVIEVAQRAWSIRLPIVNSSVVETDAGLVVIDTGMAPGGPSLLQAIRSVTDAPIHTIIYTHAHVDHTYGTWALLEEGSDPEIIAHEKAVGRFEHYIRLRGSLARYMSQPAAELPSSRDDIVWPTRTFADRLELDIGGEPIVLAHYPAETDDQLFVWFPERKALASADYYQGFLPNLGNGKRLQRGTDEWVAALREMVALGPEILLPGHGEPSTDAAFIASEFTMLADALEYIIDHTIDGLNAQLRKDQIVDSLTWPEPYASHPTLKIQYVTPKDIVKMVLKRWSGWWDDIPSHWAPAPLAAQAQEVVALAGGMGKIVDRAREVAKTDLPLACHLADWAWFADSDDPEAQQVVLDVYRERLLDPSSNTQDRLVYLDHMAAAKVAQSQAE